jgi:hypothetical protein
MEGDVLNMTGRMQAMRTGSASHRAPPAGSRSISRGLSVPSSVVSARGDQGIAQGERPNRSTSRVVALANVRRFDHRTLDYGARQLDDPRWHRQLEGFPESRSRHPSTAPPRPLTSDRQVKRPLTTRPPSRRCPSPLHLSDEAPKGQRPLMATSQPSRTRSLRNEPAANPHGTPSSDGEGVSTDPAARKGNDPSWWAMTETLP